jgi:hypothetical protein
MSDVIAVITPNGIVGMIKNRPPIQVATATIIDAADQALGGNRTALQFSQRIKPPPLDGIICQK